MSINRCAGLFILFLVLTTKVTTGEAPEEEHVPEHAEDISSKTPSPQSNTSSTATAPVQPMFPYPYNLYYANPYALYSPYLYNYQSSPYFPSPQHSTESSSQNAYPLNAAGYPFKVAHKVASSEDLPQETDTQTPSLKYTAFHSNRPYHSFEISTDKNSMKQSLVPQPSTQSSSSPGQSISSANNTETPAVNVNSVSVQAYRWPSFPSDKPATKVMHTALPTISVGNVESATLPANLNFEKETRSLVMNPVSFEMTVQKNNSVSSQESQFLPLNSNVASVTSSSEESRSEMKSGIPPNFSNEIVRSTSPSESFQKDIMLSNFNSIADISVGKYGQTGAISANTYRENTHAAEDVLGGVQNQDGPSTRLMDVLNETATFETMVCGNEHTVEDIPNTLVVQISTVYNEKPIDAPQVDPSRNAILFPISNLMQRVKNITSIPCQHHHPRSFSHSTSVQESGRKSNSIVENNRQEPESVTNENHQIGRRTKILDVTTLSSKELQEDTTSKMLSAENESRKKRNKGLPVRKRNRNIIIRLPSGQELVVDVNHSKDTYTSGEVPSEQSRQGTHSLENVLSEESVLGDRSEKENVLSKAENDIVSSVSSGIQEGKVTETPFSTSRYLSQEQNIDW